MKICLLSNALSIHTKRWIDYLQSKGHKVYLISFRKNDIKNIYFKYYEPSQNNFFYKTVFFIKNFRIIRKEIMQIKPDILHSHYVTSYGLLGALSGYKPLIVSVWGSDLFVDSKKSFFHRYIIKMVLKKANLITVMANHMIHKVKELGGDDDKIIKVTLGINIEIFNLKGRRKGDNKTVILSSRVFEKEQNIEYLINSLPYVLNKRNDIEVHFYGDGSRKENCLALVQTLGIENSTRFFGVMPHGKMPDCYREADIYVSTSISDGDHVSLMEAMACGLFPIVSDIPANLEWITNGENGFIVPLGDHELFAEKILEAVSNEELRDKVRKINFDLVKSKAGFGKDLIILENYYRKLSKEDKNNRKSV